MDVMEGRELIRQLVLDSISDDFENVDQTILGYVASTGAKLGLSVERSDIVNALAGLIEDGLAKAYLLSGTQPPRELPGMPSLDAVEENFQTYFYITKTGMDFYLAQSDTLG